MQNRFNYRWLLGGVAAIGLIGTFAPQAHAQRERRVVVVEYREEESRAIDFRELPRDVRHRLDDLRGDHEVTSIQYVRNNDRAFYRCLVKTRGGYRNIRLGTDGRLVGDDFISAYELEGWHGRGGDKAFFTDWERRQWEEEHYWAREHERVRVSVEHPERIEIDHIPPRVRATFFREAGGEAVTFIVRYRQGEDIIYQTNVSDGPGRTRVIQATPDGHLVGETTVGAGRSDLRVRTADYSELPWAVRRTVNRETDGQFIRHVDIAERHDHRIFTVQVDEGHFTRYLTINEEGRILQDVSDRR